MPVSMDLIKRVVIQGSSQGLDKLEGELKKVASSADGVTVSFEHASRSQLSAEAAYKRLSSSIDPAYRAQQQIEKGTNTLNRAFQQGVIDQEQYNRSLNQLKTKYTEVSAANDNLINKSKLSSYELINLSRQAQDVGVSLASGQSPFTVLIQQGPQIFDVFASSKAGFSGFAQQVLGFVARNPFLVLAGGIAAVGAAAVGASAYLNNYVKVLDDLSQSSGIAAKDLSQLREAMAVKGVSNADFVAGVNAIADKIAEAKKGTNELGQLFKLNGRAISDNVTNLYTLSDLVKNAADYQDKKNILEAAGIPATAEAVRLYSQGAEELRKQKEAAAGFGDDTKKLADNARAFDEAWGKAWESFKTAAVNNIAEVIGALKQLVSDPTVQAIISFLSMTPGEAYGAWKGAVTRTVDRAMGYSAGAEAFNLSYPSASSIKPELTQYGPDLPNTTQTVKALKERIRVQQEHNSLLGESATAADKLALAELKIKQAIAEGIPLTDQEMKAIRANAVAVKEKAAAHDKVGEALRRANEGRQEAVAKLELEIRDIFKSTEAMRAEKIALEEIYRLRKAGVPEDKIPFADIEANARLRAELEKQIELFKELKSAAQSFATTLLEGLAQGQNLMQSLAAASKQLGSALVSGGVKQIAEGNLITGGLMIGGGFLANLFGQNQQKKQQQQQAQQQLLQQQQQAAQQAAQLAQQQADAAQNYNFQAAGLGIDTRTQAGAMAKLEIDIQQGRLQAAKTGGAAIAAYENLAQAQRLQLAKEWAEKIAAVRLSYEDRIFAAANDNSTLAGKLAEYDRKAAQERVDAIKTYGRVYVELERAQAAERGNIIKAALKEQTDYYDGLRKSISDFTSGLNFGNLSTLSPAEQYLAARNQFQTQYGLAAGGDRTAQGGITQVAQTLIEQARNYLGPSVEYGSLVDRITQQLSALPDIALAADPQVRELQSISDSGLQTVEQLTAIGQQLQQTQAENRALQQQVAALIAAGNQQSARVVELTDKLRLELRQGFESFAIRTRAA